MGPQIGPLETELSKIRDSPATAISASTGKAWLPYDRVLGDDLAHSDDPDVTARLIAEALHENNERTFRLAMLQFLGWRSDAGADDALILALSDPVLRALAAFLLGRIGYRGYPQRDRPSRRILTALKPHLDDDRPYRDPWYDETWLTSDFVIAAFVRVAGVDRFRFVDDGNKNWIGMELPSFHAAERDNLRSQCKAFVVASVPD